MPFDEFHQKVDGIFADTQAGLCFRCKDFLGPCANLLAIATSQLSCCNVEPQCLLRHIVGGLHEISQPQEQKPHFQVIEQEFRQPFIARVDLVKSGHAMDPVFQTGSKPTQPPQG